MLQRLRLSNLRTPFFDVCEHGPLTLEPNTKQQQAKLDSAIKRQGQAQSTLERKAGSEKNGRIAQKNKISKGWLHLFFGSSLTDLQLPGF